MHDFRTILAAFGIALAILTGSIRAQGDQRLVLDHSDEFEVVYEQGAWVTYVSGNVDFQTESGHIFCDSAVFQRGKFARLRGNVFVDDRDYMLRSDSVFYDVASEKAIARGQRVELWSYADSLYGVGVHAFYDRQAGHFRMEERPVVYLGYPDTVGMIEVIADEVDYRSEARRAEAIGDVLISSEDILTESGCAVMNLEKDILDLYEKPTAQRGRSTVTGELISVSFAGGVLNRIDVIDSANGEFTEPVDSTETEFDRSILSGRRIAMYFTDGLLRKVVSVDQAYSWYYPSARGGNEYHENSVSGDTIFFTVYDEGLQQVTVIGGAQGAYVTGKRTAAPRPVLPDDSLVIDDSIAVQEPPPLPRRDTINYQAHFLEYNLLDSTITMHTRGQIRSGSMSLRAQKVELNTASRLVDAYSAEINPDTSDTKFYNLSAQLQPATIPVILQDGSDELYGDYLQYSIDTEKGRIVQTKSAFEQGYCYGRKLLREKKDVYYIDDGYFTTCDADEPHFHFHSSRMKLMEGNKLIAKPVVFYIGRIPLMAIPYYVFPLKKGRHSGFLPFTFGRFERGERYVKNVGYYWAPSDYWTGRARLTITNNSAR